MLTQTHKEFVIFAIIGVLNTIIHSSVVIFSVEYFFIMPVIANTIAFVIANTGSFFMNSKFTFKANPTWRLYKRFIAASIAAFIATILLSGLAQILNWHYLVGLGLVLIVSPILTFSLQKFWTFK